ncbi:unnamed protein product [Clonostachys rosea f. rosea IK726]|uniref:Uncharacterized protein n=1 Tax=Clonostachys rosea f. rosea IK726 TaxID=1349383 RepID=A0ACA9U034_BIOOC|nr:unnamed protein product [Clonostachys rosea f. rosea IK726]
METTPTRDLEHDMRATTEKFLKAYLDASQQNDPTVFSATLTSDCRRYIGPPIFLASMGLPQDFSFTNTEYEDLSRKDMAIWTITSWRARNITVDVANRKSAATSENLAWFLDSNEDGSKITRIYQLNDTQEAKDFRLKVEALQA